MYVVVAVHDGEASTHTGEKILNISPSPGRASEGAEIGSVQKLLDPDRSVWTRTQSKEIAKNSHDVRTVQVLQ
jgi:hypothetical protein